MAKWLKRIFLATLLCAGGVVLLAVLVLRSPLFSDFRRSIVADQLSDHIGQKLVIKGDATVLLGRKSRVVISGATIPSVMLKDVNLAELDRLELDLDIPEVFWGGGTIDDIKIDGIRVQLTTQSDGTTSWANDARDKQGAQSQLSVGPLEANGIIWFLSDKSVQVTSVNLNVDNKQTGFEFLFELKEMTIEQQAQDAGVEIDSHGTVNGQPFQIQGDYPRGATSQTSLDFGGFKVRFDGQAVPEEQGGGIRGSLSVDTGSIGDFFEVLKLDGRLEGTAEINTQVLSQDGKLGLQGLQATLELQNGMQFDLSGSASDLTTLNGFDFLLNGRFFPEGDPPKRATGLSDLALSTAKANIVSDGEGLKLTDAQIDTNMFETEFESFGPFSIGRIRRTEQGTLAFQDIHVQTGPEDAPYLVADGSVMDLLRLQGIAFSGSVHTPISLIMTEFKSDVARAFGDINAQFDLSDDAGHLALNKLEAKSANTTLWSMKANASARNLQSVQGTDFDLNFSIPDGAAFLAALQADKVDVGQVGFSASVTGIENGIETEMSVGVGDTTVGALFSATAKSLDMAKVRGRIHSDLVKMGGLDNAVKASAAVKRVFEKAEKSASASKTDAALQTGVALQPLVLNDKDASSVAADPVDTRILQPLIIDDRRSQGTADDAPNANPVALQDLKFSDLFDVNKLLRGLDLKVDLDISKIEGQAGVSSVSSALISENGQASLGPLALSYGGGRIDLNAMVDMIKTPHLLRLVGQTRGWDIAGILDRFGAKTKANGALTAKFDLTGQHTSLRRFINTMSGTANISMKDGRIATSLLELAGLGVLPWLFSKELQQGYTEITCMQAPLKIGAGKASSSAIVLETRRVQLVGQGFVDWVRGQIALRFEPRRIGHPLARSAWPFEVSGRLSNPQIKVNHERRSLFAPRAGRTKTAGQGRVPCVPDRQQSQ